MFWLGLFENIYLCLSRVGTGWLASQLSSLPVMSEKRGAIAEHHDWLREYGSVEAI
jgi:hypothetical protein